MGSVEEGLTRVVSVDDIFIFKNNYKKVII